MKIAISILSIILMIFVVIYYNDRKHWYDIEVAQRDFKNSLDTLKRRDQVRDERENAAKERYFADSIRISDIENSLARIPEMVHTIQQRYDAKRKHIDTVSASAQLQFFADWLSEDSRPGN